jgi:hypothetical protein
VSKKPKRPHDPRYALPGTPPPTPEQVERMHVEFEIHMLEFEEPKLIARLKVVQDRLAHLRGGGKP